MRWHSCNFHKAFVRVDMYGCVCVCVWECGCSKWPFSLSALSFYWIYNCAIAAIYTYCIESEIWCCPPASTTNNCYGRKTGNWIIQCAHQNEWNGMMTMDAHMYRVHIVKILYRFICMHTLKFAWKLVVLNQPATLPSFIAYLFNVTRAIVTLNIRVQSFFFFKFN